MIAHCWPLGHDHFIIDSVMMKVFYKNFIMETCKALMHLKRKYLRLYQVLKTELSLPQSKKVKYKSSIELEDI